MNGTPKSPKSTLLPIYRIKTIMRTTPDVSQVAFDATFTMAKATELFISMLAKESIKLADDQELDYKHIAEVVHHDDKFDFLRQLIPQKITVREYKEIMEKNREKKSEEDLAFYIR